MLTKKHFIALADTIRAFNKTPELEPFTLQQMGALAAFCQFQNPAFNRVRWFGYIAGECGPGGGKVK